MIAFADFDARHLSEQYFTSSQTRAHFLRHANGRPQTMHVLVGNVDLVKRRAASLLTGARSGCDGLLGRCIEQSDASGFNGEADGIARLQAHGRLHARDDGG